MKAFIVGAGAQGRVILDILRAQHRHHAIEFIDDNPAIEGQEINGAKVVSSLDQALSSPDIRGAEMIVALGNPDLRIAIAGRIGEQGIALMNAIHPSAVVMLSASLGCGIMIGAGVVVNTNTVVGDNAIINTGAVVEHDCQIAAGAAIGPGVHLGGRVTIGEKAFVATGAIVNSRLTIGARTIIGAGSVVTRSLPDDVLAFGVPARVRQALNGHFDWSRVL